MGQSLWDAAVFLNSTPGVPWLHSGPTLEQFAGRTEVVRSDIAAYRASQQIPTAYIANGDEAYVARILFLDSSNQLTLNLSGTVDATNFGASTDPQLTDDAEANLGIAFRVTGGSGVGNVYKYLLSDLTLTDDTEPYNWNNVEDESTWDAIISAISGATTVQCLFVDVTHGNIDFDLLTTVDAPLAPAAPTLTALPTSIEVTLSADPTSDANITSRDLRWKTTAGSTWTEVDSVTSPHTITGLNAETEYEVQWRAVSTAGDGAWSVSATITTTAVTPPLALSDFAVPAGHVEVDAGLITSGRNGQNWLYHSGISVGTLEDGSLNPGVPISRIRDRGPNDFQLNDNPSTIDLEAFFDTGDGADLTIHIQDADGVASIVAADTLDAVSNANSARFDTTAAFDTIVSRIADGDLFILAFTRPETYRLRGTATVPAPSAAARVSYEAPDAPTYRLRGSATVPAPSAAGRIGYTEPPENLYKLRGEATVPAPSAAGRITYDEPAVVPAARQHNRASAHSCRAHQLRSAGRAGLPAARFGDGASAVGCRQGELFGAIPVGFVR